MAYQEVKRTSYGKNIGNSLRGIIVGIILVIIATVLIFWNENRAIKTYKALDRAQDACVEMPDINTVSADFNGKTVHCTGIATTTEMLADPNFGVNVNAISLSREVEYYQWVEHAKTETKEKIGGATEETTTYTYSKEWVSSPVDSKDFKDPEYQNANYVFETVDEMDVDATVVTFGAYTLPSFVVNSIRGEEPAAVNMDSTTVASWNNDIKRNLGLDESINANYVHVNNNEVYFGASASKPEVGDVRITFTYVPNNQQISLIADVKDNTFQKHVDKNGKTVSSVVMGEVPVDQMFDSMKQGNKFLTWVIRLVLLLLIIAGFRMMVDLLPTLLKVLPFLGKGVGKILGLLCVVLGIVWTLVFIAIAWIAVRPVLAIVLLVVAVGLIVWLSLRSKKEPVETEQQTA